MYARQPNTKTWLFSPFALAKFNYASIEKSNDALKATFATSGLAAFKEEFDSYNHNYSDEKLADALHVYDINGDGRDDLIYEGKSGGEPTEVVFILNTEKGFEIVFKAFQHLKKIDVIDGRIERVYINDDGCCAAYIDFNKTYNAKYKDTKPAFKLATISANYHNMSFDVAYLKEPVPFSVLNDHYKLRASPIVDDKTGYLVPGDSTSMGNTLAELSKNTKGMALASSTDKTGRVWWLVQIPAKYDLSNSIFYEDESKIKADKIGWISSRFVKRIE